MAEEFTPIETQEAFDAAVASVLEEERAKYADYDDIKAQLNTANTENETLTGENAKLKAEALRRRVADETGLSPALAKRLTGETEEELKADAEELLKSVKPQRRTFMRNPDANDKPSGDSAYKRLLAGLKND